MVSKKRKTLKERTREALGRAQRPRVRDLLAKTNYADEVGARVREIVANKALALTDDPKDAALRRAFKEFRLDPIEPFDWRELLQIFASIHFEAHPRPPRGPRRKWNPELFYRHVEWARARTKAYLKRRGESPPTHADVALYLNVAWPDLYESFHEETLRTYVIKALSKKGVK